MSGKVQSVEPNIADLAQGLRIISIIQTAWAI